MASSTTRDYYQVLGLPRTASDKDVRSAYRRLARKYHPDLNPGDKSAESRFKELQTAYDVLSDPAKRQQYDQFGPNFENFARGAPSGGFGERPSGRTRVDFGDSGDFSDLFEGLFGGLGGTGTRPRSGFRTRARAGQDIEHPIDVSLDEAYLGTVRILEFPTRTGTPRKIEVRVPAGVKTGARIRLAGEGEAGTGGGAPGDLYLLVTVRPHPTYERKDDDLSCEIAVPLTTAVLGGEVQVPTFKGKFALRIPPETQNGQTIRMAGLGMPKSGGGYGDLFARTKVVLPTKLSPAERQLFEDFQKLRAS